jgi:hypothetical protein
MPGFHRWDPNSIQNQYRWDLWQIHGNWNRFISDYLGFGERDRLVGIATRYELGGPEFEPWWGKRFFPTQYLSRLAIRPTQPLPGWVPGLFSGVWVAGKWRWPPTPHLAPNWRKNRAVHLLSLGSSCGILWGDLVHVFFEIHTVGPHKWHCVRS